MRRDDAYTYYCQKGAVITFSEFQKLSLTNSCLFHAVILLMFYLLFISFLIWFFLTVCISHVFRLLKLPFVFVRISCCLNQIDWQLLAYCMNINIDCWNNNVDDNLGKRTGCQAYKSTDLTELAQVRGEKDKAKEICEKERVFWKCVTLSDETYRKMWWKRLMRGMQKIKRCHIVYVAVRQLSSAWFIHNKQRERR